jgi:uncharacterized protein YdeI (BOF family)
MKTIIIILFLFTTPAIAQDYDSNGNVATPFEQQQMSGATGQQVTPEQTQNYGAIYQQQQDTQQQEQQQ